jgi:hypothetical protein
MIEKKKVYRRFEGGWYFMPLDEFLDKSEVVK